MLIIELVGDTSSLSTLTTDGLVNGAIGTLQHVDIDSQGKPTTLWVKFDHEDVGKNRRQLLMNNERYRQHLQNGFTPIWKVAKNFPTCRKRLTGRIVCFPLYYAYGFTICKSQGNNHIGIYTIVHLNSRKKIPRRQLYVAFSRTDKIDNLIINGSFEDPWFREEEARKKSGGRIREDEIREGYSKLMTKKIVLTWTPLYNIHNCNKIISFFNVNSFHCHIDDVRSDFSLLASDLIFFIDTRLKNNEVLPLKGYKFVTGLYMHNDKRVPGGLCLYAKSNQDVYIIKDMNIQEKGYYGQLIVCSAGDCIIIGLYFSPKCSMKHKVQYLQRALEEILDNHHNILIGGDFNCGNSIDILLEKGFSRLPLDDTTKGATNIDQLYIKTNGEYIFGCNPCYYSDHKPTYVGLKSVVDNDTHFMDDQDCTTQIHEMVDDKANTDDKIDTDDRTDSHEMECSFEADTFFCELSKIDKMNEGTDGQIANLKQLPAKKQAQVIDRLDTCSSNDLIQFLNNHGYVTINCNSTTQIGNSCGYISASIANYIYQCQDDACVSLTMNDHPSYHPDVLGYNFLLGIDRSDAQLLDSIQIMKLVASLTGDYNLEWFFVQDVNLFKSLLASDFDDILFSKKGGIKWAVFCINDAILNDHQRKTNVGSNVCVGSHWYTVVISIE